MIDMDLWLTNLCEGKAIFGQRNRQVRLPGQDCIGVDCIAGFQRKSGSQLRLAFTGGRQPLQIHAGQLVKRSGHYLERDRQAIFARGRDG